MIDASDTMTVFYKYKTNTLVLPAVFLQHPPAHRPYIQIGAYIHHMDTYISL